jgi:hypothetical protein
MKVDAGFTRASIAHGGNQRARLFAQRGFSFMSLDQEDIATEPPQNVLAQVPGDSFRTVIPEPNLAVAINHTDTRLQAFERGTEGLHVLKIEHFPSSLVSLSAENASSLRVIAGSVGNHRTLLFKVSAEELSHHLRSRQLLCEGRGTR